MQRLEEIIADPKTAWIIDVVDLFNYTAFDIIGDLGRGKNFGGLDKLQYHPWVKVILRLKMTMFAAALKYYPWPDRIMQAIMPDLCPRVNKDDHRYCRAEPRSPQSSSGRPR